MRTQKKVLAGVLTGLLVAGFGLALGQDAQPGAGFGRGGRFDPAAIRQRMMERIKEALQSSDEEWQVLQPRIEKLQSVQRDLQGGRMMGAMGGRRGGPGGGADAAETPQSAVAKALQDLQTVLGNAASTPEDIKAKLAALREAREAARQELAKAQEAVRELITQRQEAQLVLMGLLE